MSVTAAAPDWWSDHEVMDFTAAPGASYGHGPFGSGPYGGDVLVERMLNEAARAELARRGLDPGPPSGEVAPYSIVWVEITPIEKNGRGFVTGGGTPVKGP